MMLFQLHLLPAKLDEKEVDQMLLEKFSEFEENQRKIIERLTQFEKTFNEELTRAEFATI